jgi:hypothetical protein
MLAASLPADIPVREICAVYRLRWQACPCEGEGRAGVQTAETLLNIARLPTRTEAGSLSWLYPHLILALFIDDICQEILESFPSGPC